MRTTLFVEWLAAVAVLAVLTLLGVRVVTRGLDSELTQAEAAIDQMQSGIPAPALRLPLLGEEVERGIPAFIQQSKTAQAQLAGAAKASE